MNRWQLARIQSRMQSIARGAMDDGRAVHLSGVQAGGGEAAMRLHIGWILNSSDGEAALVFAFRGSR